MVYSITTFEYKLYIFFIWIFNILSFDFIDGWWFRKCFIHLLVFTIIIFHPHFQLWKNWGILLYSLLEIIAIVMSNSHYLLKCTKVIWRYTNFLNVFYTIKVKILFKLKIEIYVNQLIFYKYIMSNLINSINIIKITYKFLQILKIKIKYWIKKFKKNIYFTWIYLYIILYIIMKYLKITFILLM